MNQGTDLILEFNPVVDKLGLSGGLEFDDLTFTTVQGEFEIELEDIFDDFDDDDFEDHGVEEEYEYEVKTTIGVGGEAIAEVFGVSETALADSNLYVNI